VDTHARRRTLLLVGGLAALVLVVVAVVVLASGGGSSPSSSAGVTPTHRSGARSTGATPAPPHDKTTVAVLNGTTVAGLANTVANRLAGDGFVRGTVTNASSQDRIATFVSYLGGHDREAAEVAKSLGLSTDAIGPIDSDTETACANGGGACTADAVVTVGPDLQ
jgi:hypothetical protein